MDGIDDTGRYERRNPFTPIAVAQVTEADSNMVTIETPAIRDATDHLDRYLASTSEATRSDTGNVIAIVGDFGTGKTHLVVQLLNHARDPDTVSVHTMYLDAPADTFTALYRRFVTQLDRNDVRERVRDYYADVVADSLDSSGPTAEVARRLRSGEIDPERVVQGFGLMDSMLLRELQRRLRGVTENDAFGTALTLLLRPGFESAVWEWLSGYRPSEILVERGITTATDNETTALEAMGVFALLYGRQNHRFVLVIDELDKVISASSRPAGDAVAAFKKLLRVFAAAGAFLVISGLPDFLQVLGNDVRQRIGHIVRMSPMSAAETRDYIERTQERAFGHRRLAPFTESTVEYMADLVDGTIRKIIRMCYFLYRRATAERGLVTEAMVRDVARTEFDFPSLGEVRKEVRRILESEGLRHERDYLVGTTMRTRADYWITLPDRPAGCAVLLSESVLRSEDVVRLAGRAEAIHDAVPDSQTLLVVVGHLPREFMAELRDAFGIEPIGYDPRAFADDLSAALKSLLGRVEDLTSGDQLAVVRDRVDRINRQQSYALSFIGQLATHLDVLQATSDRQLTAIHRELGEISRTVGGEATVPRGDQPAPRRPPPGIEALFTDALAALDEIDRVEALLQDTFSLDLPAEPRMTEFKAAVRDRLRHRETFLALGVASFLRQLVEAFRYGVLDWYRSLRTDEHGRVRLVDEERLKELCRTYTALWDGVPLLRLDGLATLTPGAVGLGGVPVPEDPPWPARRADFRELFESLGARVQDAVLTTVTDPGTGA
jgi:Cdc6-like AAA superfamily ATPase